MQFTGKGKFPFRLKPFELLVSEGFKESVRYYNGNISVTSILQMVETPLYLNYGTANTAAMDNGTILHRTIEQSYKENSFVACYSDQAKSWKKFYDEVGKKWNPVALEQEFIGHTIGGTLDAIMEIDGEQYLVDWKTAKSVPKGGYILDKYKLQLASYYKLSQLKYDVNGAILVFFLKTKYHIVKIKKNELEMFAGYMQNILNHYTQFRKYIKKLPK